MLPCEEEVRRFPFRYIELVKSLDEHMLGSNHEMRKVYQAHLHYRFARCPDLLVQEFCSYLANIPHLWEAEAAGYEGVVIECEIHDVVKQVGLNKLPGLDGLCLFW